jgi:hypothetical protein
MPMFPSVPTRPVAAAVLSAAIAACATLPAAAAPGKCLDLDKVVAAFHSQGAPLMLIPPERLAHLVRDASEITRQTYPFVTRGFIIPTRTSIVLGFESGGCLLAPIKLTRPQLQAKA